MRRRLALISLLLGAASCTSGTPPTSGPELLENAAVRDDACWADHFITYTDTPIDDAMARYRKAGFLTSGPDRTVRHTPGLRNGFVFIGPDYLEYAWVERQEEFDAAANVDRTFRLLRAGRRPYGIGFQVRDPEKYRERLLRAGFDAPEATEVRPQDAPEDAPPAWAFAPFPEGMLAGAHTFYLSYLWEPERRNRFLWMGENGIFLLVGVVFVSDRPAARPREWGAVLDPGRARPADGVLVHGPHAFLWMLPGDWYRATGRRYPPSSAPFHEIAAVVAVSIDIDRTEERLIAGGVPAVRSRFRLPLFGSLDGIVVHPDVRTGFPMFVFEGKIGEWKKWREEVQGVRLEVRDYIELDR